MESVEVPRGLAEANAGAVEHRARLSGAFGRGIPRYLGQYDAGDRSSVGPIPHPLGTASSTGKHARPIMNADDIIANDAHRDALRLSATAFTRWGIAYPANPVQDPAPVRELRV